ncbi:MAG: hypothetical protein KF776_19080 [Burkholderiales bacterium]|nr:hypothetical protein [Burkholderiales bacterium]
MTQEGSLASLAAQQPQLEFDDALRQLESKPEFAAAIELFREIRRAYKQVDGVLAWYRDEQHHVAAWGDQEELNQEALRTWLAPELHELVIALLQLAREDGLAAHARQKAQP